MNKYNDQIQTALYTESDTLKIDRLVFTPAIISISALSLGLILFPDITATHTTVFMNWISTQLGWLYLTATVGGLGFSLWLAFGLYGRVKLGRKDEPLEYGNLHWIAMMFTAGIGAGVIVWGFSEPIFYLQKPPMNVAPMTPQAVVWAHVYPLFHWGISAWAVYTLTAVPVAYLLYVKKTPGLRISAACDSVLPVKGRAAVRAAIDVMIMLGIVGGTATALGLGVPVMSAFITELTGIADSLALKLTVLVVWTLIFSASAYRGLRRGIKVLADINMVLAVFAILFVLLAGPTVFILSLTVNSVGIYLDNYFTMSLWTDPVRKSGFPETWTVFYWAWWMAYAAFIGLFIGRISRGRTIRQLVVGVIGWGSLGTCFFLSIAGGYTLYLEQYDLYPVTETLNNDGMAILVSKVIAQLPTGKFILSVFMVLTLIFFATTLDSAAYVLASICTKNLRNDQEPQKTNRLIWAFVLALLTAGLVVSGKLDTVQSTTVISSLPLIPIILFMCISLVRWLKRDFGHLSKNTALCIDERIDR